MHINGGQADITNEIENEVYDIIDFLDVFFFRTNLMCDQICYDKKTYSEN